MQKCAASVTRCSTNHRADFKTLLFIISDIRLVPQRESQGEDARLAAALFFFLSRAVDEDLSSVHVLHPHFGSAARKGMSQSGVQQSTPSHYYSA